MPHSECGLYAECESALIVNLYRKQVGSMITGKRISQLLEKCCPFSYIMVDKHPCRHDPSHIVSCNTGFRAQLQNLLIVYLNLAFPPLNSTWSIKLNALNTTVCLVILNLSSITFCFFDECQLSY